MVIQVFEDGFLECHDAAERAASDPFLGNFRKESFDLVESRSTGGREMHLEARPLGEPVFDTRGFVGRVVVHHQMDFDSRFCGDRLVNQVQELEELLLPMALVATTEHMTGGLLERTDVKPDHIPHLLHEERIGDNLKVSVRWGCRAKVRQIRETAVWLKPDVLAMPRVLQCVA